MTKALDTALRKVVVGVARALGRSVTVRVITPGTYDTSTGTASDVTADVSVQGFVLTASDVEDFGLAMVGDRAVLIPAASLTTEPMAVRDRFLVDSLVFAVSKVDRVMVRDLAACYVVQGAGSAA